MNQKKTNNYNIFFIIFILSIFACKYLLYYTYFKEWIKKNDNYINGKNEVYFYLESLDKNLLKFKNSLLENILWSYENYKSFFNVLYFHFENIIINNFADLYFNFFYSLNNFLSFHFFALVLFIFSGIEVNVFILGVFLSGALFLYSTSFFLGFDWYFNGFQFYTSYSFSLVQKICDVFKMVNTDFDLFFYHKINIIKNDESLNSLSTFFQNRYLYNFELGLDGLSLFFIIISSFFLPLCILAATSSIFYGKRLFISLLFLTQIILIFCFSVIDLFPFFFFFEAVLIPVYMIIGYWGSQFRKIKASFYFFFYTSVLSIPFFIAVILINIEVGSTNYEVLNYYFFSYKKQLLLFFFLYISFSSKVPSVPFHIWLPEAHVEAPTVGSIILAALLLKLGGYAMFRFIIPFFPMAIDYFWPLIYCIITISVIYPAILAVRQIDMKKIIAYSSISHMNLSILGIFSNTLAGIQGAFLLMVGHSFIASALFFLIGTLYDRYHTRLVFYYSGLSQVMPIFSIFFLFFSFANISFPGTVNFVAELILLFGTMSNNFFCAFIIGSGAFIGTIYSINLYNRVCFGPVSSVYLKYFIDLSYREFIIVFYLAFYTLILGLKPMFVLYYFNSYSFYLINYDF